LLEGTLTTTSENAFTLDVEGLGPVRLTESIGRQTGGKGTIAIRPEKISIGREITAADCVNRFQGKVFDYLYTGDVTLYIVETDNGKRLEVMLPNNAVGRSSKFFEPGDAVQVGWREDAGHFLVD
jgi:spermidine/putrescine transport system ATP-binding protein